MVSSSRRNSRKTILILNFIDGKSEGPYRLDKKFSELATLVVNLFLMQTSRNKKIGAFLSIHYYNKHFESIA